MRSKAIFMALLAFAFTAQAVPVSVENAKAAARAWSRQGRHLSAWVGTQVESASTLATANGAQFHVVRMTGGGSVITSGDTEVEPIVAFTSETIDEAALDPNGPLYALLNRDLSVRQTVASSSGLMAFGPTAAAAKRQSAADANARKWSSLIAAGAERSPLLSFGLDATSVSSPSDLRVDALMKTKWSQGDGIWNYYTPPGPSGSAKNAVCGCVATAAAQLMRYLHGTPDDEGRGGLEIPFPKAEVEERTFACEYRNNPLELTLQGGTYCWTNMPFTKGEITTTEQKQNIGKLTSDVGISVNMSYEMGEDGSGAITGLVPGQLMDVFGYCQAVWLNLEDGEVTSDDGNGVQGNALFANFDAGRPCTMSIPGHAIVADGYGFDADLPYTHLNMGWAGTGDLWYNLPDMTEAGAKYTAVNGIGYNVFPDVGGVDDGDQTTHAVLSGRVLDDDGLPAVGCAVTVRVGETVVTNLMTGANGIWAAILPAGTYDIEAATADGEWIGMAEGVPLEVPVTEKLVVFGNSLCSTAAYVGNSWGNDITLEHPSVRIVGVETPFSTIDRAVAAARTISAANPSVTNVLEVLDNTFLKKTQVIDFACVIVATNDDPYASAVARRNGAGLTVATNGFLCVSNVVFTGADKTLVSVASNGTVSVAGLVDFGVSYETAAVETAASDGFLLAAPIERGFTLRCDVAREAGQRCGIGRATTMPVFEAITNCASKIANFYDPVGEIRARVHGGPNDYSLVWADQPVPLEDSVGFYIDKDGATNTAARLDKLVADYERALADGRLDENRRIVIRKGGTLSCPLTTASGRLSLTGEGSPVVTLAGTAGFTLTGGTQEVAGVVFSNYVGNAVFLVNGEAAALKVRDVTFVDIKGTNEYSGAVTLLKGSADIGGGSVFDRCKATGVHVGRDGVSPKKKNAYGGAVYLESGSKLALTGCTITNCWAVNYGGGVYAKAGTEVSLSGKLRIAGNSNGSTGVNNRDDLHLRNPSTNPARLILVGAVRGSVGVRWGSSYSDGFGNTDGTWLAETDVPAYAHESADAFFSDPNGDLIAEPVETDTVVGLKWTNKPVGPQPWTGDPENASARVTYAAGGDPVYYLLVSEALESLTADATVEIIGPNGCYITRDLAITNRVTFKSDVEEGCYVFERRGNCSIKIGAGASLTLQDVTVHGCEMTNDPPAVIEWQRAEPNEWTTVPVFDVAGGSLTLKAPSDADQYETRIAHVYADKARAAGAVHVTHGGTFAMESGTVVRDCFNLTSEESDGTGRGGAVLVDDGVANLTGGMITNCCATNGGGIFVGSRGVVNVSGDCTIRGNVNLAGEDDNLHVSDTSGLVLSNVLSGAVGYTSGVQKDKIVFGRVADGFPGTLSNAVESAHNFSNDRTGDIGMVVTNATERLLVWGSMIAADGTYTNGARVVYAIAAGREVPAQEVSVPSAETDLVYNGEAQVGVAETVGCLMSGNVATNAGNYTATVTPRPGFSWSDGTTDPKSVVWSIAKATYDMSGVTFEDATFYYDGKEHVLTVSGELPAGVTVTYSNNSRTALGEQEATATFDGDDVNYNSIPNKTATLTVENAPGYPPIPPTDEPEYVDPKPIAFKSIKPLSETEWQLVVTDAVQWCNYRLFATNTLEGGFVLTNATGELVLDPVTNFQWTLPSSEIRLTVPADGDRRFWKIEGRKGQKRENE